MQKYSTVKINHPMNNTGCFRILNNSVDSNSILNKS